MLPHNAAEPVDQPAAPPQESLMRAQSAKPPQALEIISDFLDKGDMKNLDVALGKKLGLALLAVPAPAFANERDGWLGWPVDATEFAIKGVHEVLGPGSYGYAIILFTLFIKAITFPLNYQQIESSTKMSALQPKVKKLQEKYRNDPQTMNQKMGELYMGANVNPLSALLPTFAQLPILISLYKGLNYLAEEDALEEPFLWLPNLEGPTFGNRGMDWLLNFSEWHNGVPPLGWADTIKFFSLPVILVATQKASIALNKPPDVKSNPQQEQTYKILGYLPFVLGLTSCSVPAGLSIYWIVNNVLTTGTTLAIKKRVTAEMEEMELASATKPMRTEPDFSRGFGGQTAKVISTTRTDSGSTVTIRPPGAAPDAQATAQVMNTTVANASTEPVDVTAEVVPEDISRNQMKKKARSTKAVKKKKKKGR
jgi:YidC/Oxa1 family membrane protein insertase